MCAATILHSAAILHAVNGLAKRAVQLVQLVQHKFQTLGNAYGATSGVCSQQVIYYPAQVAQGEEELVNTWFLGVQVVKIYPAQKLHSGAYPAQKAVARWS